MSRSESYSNRNMEQKQNLDFKALSLQMQKGLGHIGRLRKLFRVLTSIVYLATLVWFGFCLFGGFLIDRFGNWNLPFETSMALMALGVVLAFRMQPESRFDAGAEAGAPAAPVLSGKS